MRRMIVSLFLVLGMGAALPAYAENTVQGNQSSSGASASSGNANGTNANNTSGPAAAGSSARGTQSGNNSAQYDQNSNVKVGDAVAGAQIVGVVGGNATVQTTNNADNPTAITGTGTINNTLNGSMGVSAIADPDDATATGNGDNTGSANQRATLTTGDAVAGSVVIGIVGDGEHTVQSTNNATCDPGDDLLATPCAVSGDGFITNDADFEVGSVAVAEAGADLASATQNGDNDFDLGQDAVVATGDALFGSEVVGVVGGSANIQLNNNSECDFVVCAASGFAGATNLAALSAGATAFGSDSPTAQQTGDNTLGLDQTVQSSSGDALSGAQIVAGVGGSGDELTIQANNNSDTDSAFSGNATGTNVVPFLNAGANADTASGDASATQDGSNDVAISQDSLVNTGDAVAGGQVLSGVGYDVATVQGNNNADSPTAISGSTLPIAVLTSDLGTEIVFAPYSNIIGASVVTSVPTLAPLTHGTIPVNIGAWASTASGDATAMQTHDNSFSAEQTVEHESGDAVSGAQVTGLVDIGSEATVQNNNTASDAFGSSGVITPGNTAEAVVGTLALGDDADSTQNGSNTSDVSQDASGASGDAVVGSQVTGVVGSTSADVAVQTNNNCEGEPCATALTGDYISPGGFGNILDLFTGASSAANGEATTSQTGGDNDAAFDQTLDISTGDAVGGSQVGGIVAGGTVDVQANNSADAALAVSGSAPAAVNSAGVFTGASSDALGDATTTSNVDDSLVFTQDVTVATGDAVGGSQIHGLAGTNDGTVQVNNDDDASTSVSGTGDAQNNAFGVTGTDAYSDTGTATSTSNGDADSAGDQTTDVSVGDAVAGGQISGITATE